jgi:hypothetical protein
MEASILVLLPHLFATILAKLVPRVLASIDRFVSLGMGRPTALQSEEFVVVPS